MAIQIQGNNGVISEVDGTLFRASRVTLRPVESLGSYQVNATTGTMAAGAAANSEIMQFRWTDAARFAIIHSIRLQEFHVGATGFAVGFFNFNLIAARAWTVDGTGGTLQTLTGNNAKMRTSMGTSLLGALRIATTAALGAGTKTFDANNFQSVHGVLPVTANIQVIPNAGTTGGGDGVLLYDAEAPSSMHPICLAQNEGISLRATVPATGVWVATMSIRWSEVVAY